MNKHRIFRGLNLTTEESQELALYWKTAGNCLAIIDSRGWLSTSKGTWNRPMAHKSFRILKEALKENDVPWIIVQEHQIIVDFSKLVYNQHWILRMLREGKMGVKDSENGLKIYNQRECFGQEWFEEMEWSLSGVTVSSLGLTKSKAVCLYPNRDNPDDADWQKLYFVA